MITTIKDYQLIDIVVGRSHGGFAVLDEARHYARTEGLSAWEIWEGETRIERHDPRAPDRVERPCPLEFRRHAMRCAALAEYAEPPVRERLAAMVLTYLALACELERMYALMGEGEPTPAARTMAAPR